MIAAQHAQNVAVVRGLLERHDATDLTEMLGLNEEYRHTAPEPQLRRTPGLRPRPIYHGNS